MHACMHACMRATAARLLRRALAFVAMTARSNGALPLAASLSSRPPSPLASQSHAAKIQSTAVKGRSLLLAALHSYALGGLAPHERVQVGHLRRVVDIKYHARVLVLKVNLQTWAGTRSLRCGCSWCCAVQHLGRHSGMRRALHGRACGGDGWHRAKRLTVIVFRSGPVVMQILHLYLLWPTAPPRRSWRPAFPPPCASGHGKHTLRQRVLATYKQS